MPLLALLGAGIADLGLSLVKSPFVQKMLIFGFFSSIITLSLTYLKGLITPYIVNNSLLSIVAYFGFLDGLSLYITILLAGFGVKQILAFIRS